MGAPHIIRPANERIIIMHHPNAHRIAGQCADEVRTSQLTSPVEVWQTGRNAEENAAILMKQGRPGDSIGGVFGDGSLLSLLEAMQEPELAYLTPAIAVTSLRGGNARDAGRAWHGAWGMRMRPSHIFERAVQVRGYLMEYTGTSKGPELDEGQPIHGYAASYIGAGKTARTATELARPEYRQGLPIIRDVRVGSSALLDPYAFALTDNDGQVRTLSDLTLAKGRCMAKIGHFDDVEHWDEEFLAVSTGRGIRAGSLAVARLVTGQSGHATHHSNTYTFTPHTEVSIHFDGEPAIPLMPNQPFSVGLAKGSYNLLTTRLSL